MGHDGGSAVEDVEMLMYATKIYTPPPINVYSAYLK